ncbi:MAG: SprT-like domain-containing protein [Verrucomicrobiales bacterium]|nr:SprT-like domain-containing protein [Verrucomicrobiales bacterium]
MTEPVLQLELFSNDTEQASSEDKSEPQQARLAASEGAAPVIETELSFDALDEQHLIIHLRRWLSPLRMSALSERLQVRWNSRLQTTAGRAHYRESRIELNPRLIAVADLAEIERTMKHELAHLVAYERCPKGQRRKLQAHGVEWREACADLGIAGEARCHELALPGRKMRRKYAYVCPSCSAVIERVRRFKGYISCYPCCKQYSGGRYDKRFQLVERCL